MREKILDKIKKLQALAENNPSENEAFAAAAKVQMMLLEHNLEMRDVDGHDLPGREEAYEKIDQFLNATAWTMKWKSALYYVVSQHNFCQTVRHPGTTKLSMIGKRQNIDTVIYLSEYLISQIERLAAEAARHRLAQKALYTREFCYGAMCRINQRLKTEADRAARSTAACTALVTVSAQELKMATAVHFPRLQKSHSSSTRRTGGYDDGQRAGAALQMPGRGVTGSRESRQLA